ncbi:MAG: GntR family transcriptional regulator [Caldilinea sp.]
MNTPVVTTTQTTLTDTVTAQLRRYIFTGELRPGERLSEPQIAELLQVSRSPVREAMQRLTNEGLLVRQENRRVSVWEATEADVDEIFSLRVMLESLAAERTVYRLDQSDYAALEAIIQHQRELIEQQEYVALIHEDKLFHEYFIRRAEHSRLLEWWNQIMGQWEVLIYRRFVFKPFEVVPSIINDHCDLLGAFVRRDLDGILALHRSINERVRYETVLALQARRQSVGWQLRSERSVF